MFQSWREVVLWACVGILGFFAASVFVGAMLYLLLVLSGTAE